MLIIGIHKDPWHDTGVCGIKIDNEFKIANVSEERFDRIKDSRRFPHQSLKMVLRELGEDNLNKADLVILDYIVDKSNWRLDQFKRPCSTHNDLSAIDDSKIHIVNHHLAHAYAVYFSSNFDEAAILIVDGRGSDKETQSLFYGKNNNVELISFTKKIGIGLLYSAVTHEINFGLLQEGKTMGLAPYGKIFQNKKKIFNFKNNFKGIETDYSYICHENEHKIKKFTNKIENFDDKCLAAFEVQEECERAMLHLAKYAKSKTNSKNLCISGGVGLNSVANNKILESGIFEKVFINPAASDTGIPLGLALYGYHKVLKNKKNYNEISPYLGPTYSQNEIENAISKFKGFKIIRKNSFTEAVKILQKNSILGRFEGRSEMGPRALGHRSILMSPIQNTNKDILNKLVKFRENFRPFAPAVLKENASEFFEINVESPYMLLIPKVTKKGKKFTPATTHVDGTARLQTVTKERNGNFYELIREFGEKTGVPVLLNTSFNIANEPIVETPEDAIKCFLLTKIDALLIEDILLIKTVKSGV